MLSHKCYEGRIPYYSSVPFFYPAEIGDQNMLDLGQCIVKEITVCAGCKCFKINGYQKVSQ